MADWVIDSQGNGFRRLPMSVLNGIWSKELSNGDYAEKTISSLARRMVLWFQSLGILAVDSSDNVTHRVDQGPPVDLAEFMPEGGRSRGRRLFLGEAPPHRVLDVLQKLREPHSTLERGDRNSLYALMGLRLIDSSANPVLLERPKRSVEEFWLAEKVLAQSTVRVALDLMSKNPHVGGLEVGEAFAARFGMRVSQASLRRYGSGVLVWVNWLEEIGIVRFDRPPQTTGAIQLTLGNVP